LATTGRPGSDLPTATAGSEVPNLLDPRNATQVAAAARARTIDVASALGGASSLEAPSRLSGWDLLTIACHLRYGARASQRMTKEALAGITTSFYPLGRELERPGTLAPDPGEDPASVVASLGEESAELHDSWAALSASDWGTEIEEPSGAPDLGRITIAQLALLRLTEVEVHGGDLGIGLEDWSTVFVSTALPVRIAWLATRRSNHKAVDPDVQGSWLLCGDEDACWRVAVDDDRVTSGPVDRSLGADCEIHASSRDLLATLVGRPTTGVVSLSGDVSLARAFGRAFPGP
jgi:uncharacterized protein (TIGR03083 family)